MKTAPLLLTLCLCACPRSNNGAATAAPGGKLNPLDANLVRVGNKAVEGHVAWSRAAAKNGVVSPQAEVERFLKALPPNGEDPFLKPFPTTQHDHDAQVKDAAWQEKCEAQVTKEIETWFVRWEAYHPKEDPACAIIHEAKAALDAYVGWGTLCDVSHKTTEEWAKCMDVWEEKPICASLLRDAWSAIEHEIPGRPDCK